jgi:hypothetical protein
MAGSLRKDELTGERFKGERMYYDSQMIVIYELTYLYFSSA